jgi:hypothetical protein
MPKHIEVEGKINDMFYTKDCSQSEIDACLISSIIISNVWLLASILKETIVIEEDQPMQVNNFLATT